MRVNIHGLVQRTARAEGRYLAMAILVFAAASLVGALRWQRLTVQTGVPIPTFWAIRASFAGFFVGQFLPSTIGGDGARLWLLWRAGRSLRGGAASIVLDRIIGLLGVLGLVFLSLAHLVGLAAPTMVGAASGVSLVLTSAILGLMLLGLPLPRRWLRHGRVASAFAFFEDIRRALRSRAAVIAFALSIAVQLLIVAAVVMIAAALRLQLSFADATGIVSMTVLVSAVPVSVNGWGVREGAMIAGFALVGIPQQEALLISLLFGVVSMAASLPGAIFWLASWRVEE